MLLVEQLLALADSPEVDEARTASYAAVRLIKKHKIVLTLPARGAPVSFPAPKVDVASVVREKKSPTGQWRDMEAKYQTACKHCDKPIRKDQPIKWARGKGAFHPKCYVEMEKEKKR